MKKLLALALALGILFCMVACDGAGDGPDGGFLKEFKYVSEYDENGREIKRDCYDGEELVGYDTMTYDESGKLATQSSYAPDGTLVSLMEDYDGENFLKWTTYYEDGQTVQQITTYDKNHQETSLTTYTMSGKPNTVYTFYKGGGRESISSYNYSEADQLLGYDVQWYNKEGHEIRQERYWEDGSLMRYTVYDLKEDGTFKKETSYFSDNRLDSIHDYTTGENQTVSTYYTYADRQLLYYSVVTSVYINENKEMTDTTVYYAPDGTVLQESDLPSYGDISVCGATYYSSGKTKTEWTRTWEGALIALKEFAEDGKVTADWAKDPYTGEVVFEATYESGVLLYDTYWNSGSVTRTEYYENGKAKYASIVNPGGITEYESWFNENGELTKEISRYDRVLTTYYDKTGYKTYNENNVMVSETLLDDQGRVICQRLYDDNGVLIEERNFTW